MSVEKIEDCTVEEIKEILKDAGIEGEPLVVDLQGNLVDSVSEGE